MLGCGRGLVRGAMLGHNKVEVVAFLLRNGRQGVGILSRQPRGLGAVHGRGLFLAVGGGS